MTAEAPLLSPPQIVTFWRAAGPDRWFKADVAFDAHVRETLLAAHEDAVRRGAGATPLPDYESTPEGTLALLLLLDQVPRNCFRNTPRAFASDAAARQVSARALEAGFDARTEALLRGFFYLPLMHAEDLAAQERSVALYEALGDPEQLRYAVIHRDIIARFGRFPHRNVILDRPMREEEAAFLAEGGFAG